MEKVFMVKDARGTSKFVVDFDMASGCYYKYLDGKAPTLTNLLLALTHLVHESKVPAKEGRPHRDCILLHNYESDIRYTPRLWWKFEKKEQIFRLPLTVDGDEILDYEAVMPADLVLKLVLGTTMQLGDVVIEANRPWIIAKYGVSMDVVKRWAVA